MPAFRRVENLMREVAAEEEGLAAALGNRNAQAIGVAIEADENASLAKLFFEIDACFLTWLRPADHLTSEIELHVAVVIRAVAPVHHKRHPGRAAFQKRNAQFGKAVEYAMAEHIREILKQEQEHRIDLATALGIDVPPL